jgi:hypothetical protein
MLGKQGEVRSIIVIAVWFWLVWLLADSFVRPANAAVEKDLRIALVVGNSRYKDAPLKNPANDARLMAKNLRKFGFQVLERVDMDQKGMKRAIQEFGDRLERAGAEAVGLFYYAGHGVQVHGRNYLIPVGATIQREGDVDIEAVTADSVLSYMEFARNRLNIVILDACRNNPYARSFRSVTRGLARMDAPRGTLIAYATAPGKVAMDGKGANSPYTEALVKAMEAADVPVEQMFKKVRLTVMAETNDIQVPWEASSLTGNFYFNRPAFTAVVAGKTQPKAEATPAAPGQSVEMLFWQSIQDSKDRADFEGYLRKYPDGEFTILAKNRLAAFEFARKKFGEEKKSPSMLPTRDRSGVLLFGIRSRDYLAEFGSNDGLRARLVNFVRSLQAEGAGVQNTPVILPDAQEQDISALSATARRLGADSFLYLALKKANRIFFNFVEVELSCFDVSGKLHWQEITTEGASFTFDLGKGLSEALKNLQEELNRSQRIGGACLVG